MKFPIYEIHYHTNGRLECFAGVAAESDKEAENLLEKKCREDYRKLLPRVDSFFCKIEKTVGTEFNSDKKGIIVLGYESPPPSRKI